MTESQPRSAADAQPLSPADERLWSTLAHIGNVVGFLPSLLILLLLGPRSARVREESREALNFVITAIIALVALGVVSAILGGLSATAPGGIAVLLGLLVLLVGLVEFAVYVLVVVCSIVAAVRVNAGGAFRYPFALRLIKEKGSP